MNNNLLIKLTVIFPCYFVIKSQIKNIFVSNIVEIFVLKVLLVFSMLTGSVYAVVEPERTGVRQYELQLSELKILNEFRLPNELPIQAASRARADMKVLGLPVNSGRVDIRGASWATLIFAKPMIPGKGVDNALSWNKLGLKEPKTDFEFANIAARIFRNFIQDTSQALRINLAELKDPGKVTVNERGGSIKIYIPRVYKGVSVRGSYLTATISHGNLTLFGVNKWGNINTSIVPRISQSAAHASVQSHISLFAVSGTWGKTELALIPIARGKKPNLMPVGQGYDYRLAWVIRPEFRGELGNYEALVDARNGQLLSFEDTNEYVSTARKISGGVYPVSNDGIFPDGVEQFNWPMPFDNILTPEGTVTTDSGGNLPGLVDGNITSTLSGPFVNIIDTCGGISLTSSGDLDFGGSTGTDCTTPGVGGSGNTHAARTGFYELNRIIEIGRAHLPSNFWLQLPLTSNMNIDDTCNAFWSGSAGTVNFFSSGDGCSNTGEIAGIFDHEWGHGLDANDAVPTISSPSGEGIADIYAALRLNTSCIGRNFRSTNCSGFGDPCTDCTGVRDIDYFKRVSGLPHDYSWSNANCSSSVHCTGSVYAEAVWSLWKRQLQSPPYSLDDDTAHEIVTRLTFIGASNTGTWFSGGPPEGGCAANSGYLNYLVADDDDGNLNNGTPHMVAIYDAFNQQEIACNTPTVQDSGCGTAPTLAPVVTASALNKEVSLDWGAVPGASSYDVFRTDGVHGCDFGKLKVTNTLGTSFIDAGLQNGRNYSYVVIPKGNTDACFGSASTCTTVAPAEGPNIAVNPDSIVLSFSTGDGDTFVDNFEVVDLSINVVNTGLGELTNVRLTGVEPVSHPETIVTTTFPVSLSNLLQGTSGIGSFNFTAGGLAFGDSLVFEVSFTSTEIFPIIKTQTLTISDVSSDLQSLASKTWNFETNLDGWTLVDGTFNQTNVNGGANGSTGSVSSSALLDDQCDQVRSPVIQLTATSTLALSTNYEIEEFSNGQWWDRANIAIFEGGTRSAVDPDGGRLYNAFGAGATCVTLNQAGWANVNNSWGLSSWSSTALDAANRAGKKIQLDVAYGTDAFVNGKGFWFDLVTVTDVELLVADGQSVNLPPTVIISAPTDNSSFEHQTVINFTATALDPEDGDISSSIVWLSSSDGELGSGTSINTSSLSLGVHTISSSVTDSGDPTASPKDGLAQITVTIFINQPPTVTITTPTEGASFVQGLDINFTGAALDNEDGNISTNISWWSNVDGLLGSGTSIDVLLSDGVHTISAVVADSGGLQGNQQISLTITPLIPANNVHVEGIVTGTESATKGKKYGTARVTIFYDNGSPVGAGYQVIGDFSGSFNDIALSALTDNSGVANIRSMTTAKNNIVVNFCVRDVINGLTYVPNDNTSPAFACGISTGPTEVYVESVSVGAAGLGGGFKAATATVVILGNNGQPQAGYMVAGSFSGDFNEDTLGRVTDANGTVSFQSAGTKKGKINISFCVSDVTGSLGYSPDKYVCPLP